MLETPSAFSQFQGDDADTLFALDEDGLRDLCLSSTTALLKLKSSSTVNAPFNVSSK